MLLRLLIDNRESQFVAKMEEFKVGSGVVVEKAQLILGDVQIFFQRPGDKEHLLFVIERKTTADLLSSIIDGRYSDQCSRLKMIPPTVRVVVLHEDDGSGGVDPKLLACASTFALSGFSIIHTRNTGDSIIFIKNLMEKIIEAGGMVGGGGSADVQLAGKNKVSIEGPDGAYLAVLKSIRGIPKAVVSQIHTRWPTLRQLAGVSVEELMGVPKVGKTIAMKLSAIAKELIGEVSPETKFAETK